MNQPLEELKAVAETIIDNLELSKEYRRAVLAIVVLAVSYGDQLVKEFAERLTQLNFMAMCPDCGGVGEDENATFWCSRCHGEGWIKPLAQLTQGTNHNG